MPFQLLLSLVTKSAAWFSVGKLCVWIVAKMSLDCVTLLFPFPIFTSHYIRNECTRSTRKEDSIARKLSRSAGRKCQNQVFQPSRKLQPKKLQNGGRKYISSKSEVLSGARAACINFPRSVRTSAKIGGEKEESS